MQTTLAARRLLVVLGVLLIANTALATWSIVVTDRATGEVVVAGATCLARFDLKRGSPVMLVGIGGAAAQSALDGSGANRRIIWDEMMKGTAPDQILEILRQNDSQHQSRQYGFADLQGRSLSFSGSQDGSFAGHAYGSVGTLAYAIQGNVLTGSPVVEKAKQALLGTSGDRDGDCNKSTGCVSGDYYLDINLPLDGAAPDPVFMMVKEVEEWRAGLVGRPDHIHSLKSISPGEVPADGVSQATLTISLRDVEQDPIKHGGALLSVAHDDSSAKSSTIGPVIDHGDGSYTCVLTAGTQPGTDVFRVVADDGIRPVTLYPLPQLQLVPPLWSRSDTVSAGSPEPIELVLHGPARRPYLLTLPPLVPPTGGSFLSFPGKLDPHGMARLTLNPTSAQLTPLVGVTLAFQFVTLAPVDFISNIWTIEITN